MGYLLNCINKKLIISPLCASVTSFLKGSSTYLLGPPGNEITDVKHSAWACHVPHPGKLLFFSLRASRFLRTTKRMVVHEEGEQRFRRGRVRGDHTTLADEGREQGHDFRWLTFGLEKGITATISQHENNLRTEAGKQQSTSLSLKFLTRKLGCFCSLPTRMGLAWAGEEGWPGGLVWEEHNCRLRLPAAPVIVGRGERGTEKLVL